MNSWLHVLLRRFDESKVWRYLGLVGFFAAIVLLITRTNGVLNIPGDPFSGMWGLQDFRDAVYYPVVALFAGDNPYHSAAYMSDYPVGQHFPPYSPLVLVLHSALTLTDLTTAGWVYFFCITMMYLALVYLSLRYCELPTAWTVVLLVTAALLVSRPGYMNLTIGQVGAQLSIASLIAVQFSRSRPWVAAVALAFLSIKITWFVPLVFLLWMRGDRQACLRGVVVAVVVTIGPLLWVVSTAGGFMALLESLPGNVDVFQAQSDALSNFTRVDIVSLVTRLTEGILPWWHKPLLTTLLLVFVAWRLSLWRSAVYAKALGYGAGGGTRRRDNGVLSADSTVIVLTMLACTYHQPYDLVILVPLFLATAVQLDAGNSTSRSQWFTVSSIVLLLALAALGLNFVSSHGVLPGVESSGWFAKVFLESLNGLLMILALIAAIWRMIVAQTD